MTRATVLRLGLLATLWGSSFLFIKLGLEGLSAMQVVLGRLSAGAVVLLGILLVRRQRLPRAPVIWGHLLLLAIVGNIIPFFLFGFGGERITSGLSGVLNGTTPLFTMLVVTAALPSERLSRRRASGIAVGFLGVVLIVGPWDANPLTSSVSGQLACLGAAACYAVAWSWTRRFLSGSGHSPLVLAAGQISLGAVALWVASPVVATGPIDLTATVVLAVLALGGLGTGIAFLLNYRIIADAGATTASTVTYLVPVIAVALGVVVLGEPVTPNMFAGAAVVIGGLLWAEGRLGR